MKPWQMQLVVVAAVTAVVGLAIDTDQCRDAWVKYGLSLPACPVGNLRQTATIEVNGLRRGAEGHVFVGGLAHYTTKDADAAETVPVPRFRSLALALVDAKDAATPIPVERWVAMDDRRYAKIKLPEVPDGDYQLHATYETAARQGRRSTCRSRSTRRRGST